MRQNGLIVALAGAISAGAAASDYSPGFVWDRSADWDAGKAEGYGWQGGNPAKDSQLGLAWAHEAAKGGGGLNDGQPWYKAPKTLLVWDSNWYGGGDACWASGDNQYPPIFKTLLQHVVSAQGDLEKAPLVRWINPTGANVTVHITGSVKITWSGNANLNVPLTAELAIVAVTPDDKYTVLFSGSYADPNPNDGQPSTKTVQVDVPQVQVPDGGSVLIGIRGTQVQSGRWFNMEDNLKVTLDAIDGGGGCVPDIDGNGVLDLFDFLGFVNLFNAGC